MDLRVVSVADERVRRIDRNTCVPVAGTNLAGQCIKERQTGRKILQPCPYHVVQMALAVKEMRGTNPFFLAELLAEISISR